VNRKFNFDFAKNSKKYFTISLVIFAIGIICTLIFGVNLDIQFKGGTIITYLYDGEIDAAKFKETAEAALDGISVSVTTGTDFNTGKNNIQLSLLSNVGLTADKQIVLSDAIEEAYADNNIELGESTDVSPSAGKTFFAKCIVAVIFSAIVLIIYIAVRFKNIGGWLAGLCAIIALLHDVFIVYTTFVVFRMDIDANFVAVVLTILGYSINDTIVIYDRIRENERIYHGKKTFAELVNMSTNQSLTRSIHTLVTTIFAMAVVSIVAMVYGVTSIISFSFPMIIGLLSGTYSSVCIAAPLWITIKNRADKGSSDKNNAEPAGEQPA